MARKSKGFGELLRAQSTPQKSMEKLQKRVKEESEWGKTVEIISNTEGHGKMSEVLEEFVEPYLYTVKTYEQQKVLLTIAAFAWNLTLLPEADQQTELDNIIHSLSPKNDQQAEQDMREILEEMITRKQDFFADNKRYILDFELQRGSREHHLSVISTIANDSDSEVDSEADE